MKTKIIRKTKKLMALILVLLMAAALVPPFTLPTFAAAAAHPTSAVQMALSGNGYGTNSKFLVPVESPPKSGSRAISTAAELQKIGGDYPLNGDYHLTADIDLDGIEWEPIGDSLENSFKGTFDGQGHVIRNMTISGECEYSGLFGIVGGLIYSGASYVHTTPTIVNIGLENVDVDTDGSASGLVHTNARGYLTIANCYVTGEITANGNGASAAGIFSTGWNPNPSGTTNISNCYNAASVTAVSTTFRGMLDAPVIVAKDASAGGISGSSLYPTVISNCYNTGDIKADSTGSSYAGGIAAYFGAVYYSSAYDGDNVVRNCGNMGNVTVTSSDELSDTSLVSAGGIIGGTVIDNPMGITSACFNSGNISAELTTANTTTSVFAGGIGGRTNAQDLADCYNTGNVSAANANNSNGYAGGILGRSSGKDNIRRCYSTGNISGVMPGAIAGLALSGGIIRSSFYEIGSAPKSIAEYRGGEIAPSDATVLTAEQMKLESSFSVFNFTKTWGFKSGENGDYPVLQAFYPDWSYTPTIPAPGPSRSFLAPIEPPKEGSFPIGSVEELQKIGKPDGYPLTWDYHLTANLNLLGTDWEPIGPYTNTSSSMFEGTFDGQGYAIHNLEITGAQSQCAGLFAAINGKDDASVIKNLALENVYINVFTTSGYGHLYVGALVGYNSQYSQADISNCYVTGSVSATTTAAASVGGLVGYDRTSDTLTDCFSAANVTGIGKTWTYAGGIAGRSDNAKIIRNCHNIGNISSETNGDSCSAGGIIGYSYDATEISNCSNTGNVSTATSDSTSTYLGAGGIIGVDDYQGRITACYNTGDISAISKSSTLDGMNGNAYAGGISGHVVVGKSVMDCYNTGNISAMDNDKTNGSAGGIVGRNTAKGSVLRCYSTGSVSAERNPGGIVGLALKGSLIKDSFWNSDAAQTRNGEPVAQADKNGIGAGEGLGFATPLTAAQMKEEASYANIFSLTQTWGFKNGENNGYPILRAFYPNLSYTPSISPPPVPEKKFTITEFAPPAEGSIPISTREELDNIRNNLDGKYHLTADIDLTGVDWRPIGDYNINSGDSANMFRGVFDGQGHVITGLTVVGYQPERTSVSSGTVYYHNSDYFGLFGYVSGNVVMKNVGLENVCIYATHSTNYAGGLLGMAATTSNAAGRISISNCYVTGQVSTVNGYAGGIAGSIGGSVDGQMMPTVADCHSDATVICYTQSGEVGGIAAYLGGRASNCRNTGNVILDAINSSSYDSYVGGIAGYIYQAVNCVNTGKITANTGSGSGDAYIGGIAGELYTTTSRGSTGIRASSNSGDVVVTSPYNYFECGVGGIVGTYSGNVVDCYNRGNITVNTSTNSLANAFAAGIAGKINYSMSEITRCYSTGNITGPNVGGIAGSLNYGSYTTTVTDTFFNKESSQYVGSILLPESTRKGIASGSGSAVGLTAAQMKQHASFTGFDFDDVWSMASGQNDGYPILRQKPTLYVVTVKTGSGSSGSAVTAGYAKGAAVPVVAPAPNTNYRFKEWTATPNIVFADKNSAETTFIMPDGDVTVTANYESIPFYTATVTGGSGGGSNREGTTVTINVVTPTGKQFKEWEADGEDVVFADKTSRSTTFVMPGRNVTVTAIYDDIPYTVTVNGGTANTDTATVNTVVTVTADAPAEGKRFKQWTASGITFESAGSPVTTFVMPQRNVTVTATYENIVKGSQTAPSAPTLHSKTSTMVILNTIPGAEYRCGTGAWQDSTEFTDLNANTNYYFYARLKETDTLNASSSSSSLTVRTDADINTVTYRVTFRNGSTSVYRQVKHGESVVPPSWSKTGYVLSWDRSLSNITADQTINAVWTAKTYTVTFKDGSVTLKTQSGVKHGTSAVSPSNPMKKGYVFDGWDKDFSNVTEALVVNAKWKAIVGKITPTSKKTVKRGKTLKLTAEGNADIKSVKWTTSKKGNVKIKSGGNKKTVTLQGVKKGKKATIKAVITFKDGTKKTVKRVITVK